jgi:CubicO group peptidase (beta-lactamase class C family)
MKDWKMPGMAVAVVKGGQVVLLEGYGLRDLEGKLPVTPRTIFPIASITKSFTVAALASLAAEGKLDWDEPVHDLLPGFRLYDDVATIRVTPRDLVTHRTGLPRHDAMWYFGEPSRATMVEHLRFLEPSRDLRSAWQYNNLAFVTAGYLAGKLAGSSWEDIVRTRLFEPLGMRRSGFSIGAAKSDPDVAHPYQKDDQQEVKAIPYYEQTEMGPAGTIVSTADDLSRYLLMHLAKGKFDGRQVLAEADVTAMQTPQMVTPTPLVFPEISHTSYGMGLFVTTYRGHKLVHHGGNIDGFSLLLSFLPQDDMGVIALTNLNGTPYPSIVTYQVYDRLLGLAPVDWNARYLDRQSKTRASEDEAKAKGYTPRKTGTHPSHDLADYVGDYEHAGYGLVHVGGAGEDLTLTYNKARSTLKHFHYDVFDVPANALDRLERTKVMFRTGWNGDIDGLSIGLEPQVKDIVFARVADRSMRERGFLEPLAGAYELGPTPVTVTLRGDGVLVLAVPGQPPRELEPVRGTTFTVKGLSGYQVVFKKDDSGRVVEVAFQQPGANYVAKRKRDKE